MLIMVNNSRFINLRKFSVILAFPYPNSGHLENSCMQLST